jgi:hypothetical protein
VLAARPTPGTPASGLVAPWLRPAPPERGTWPARTCGCVPERAAASRTRPRWPRQRRRRRLELFGRRRPLLGDSDPPPHRRSGPLRTRASSPPLQSSDAEPARDQSSRGQPRTLTVATGRRHKRANSEGRTSPDACFLGEQERRARRSSRPPRVRRRRVLPRECERRGRAALAPPSWQSASPCRPWQTPPGASSRAAGQLTLIRSAVAASAAYQWPEAAGHGQLLPSTGSVLELAAGRRYSRTASQDPASTRPGACWLSAQSASPERSSLSTVLSRKQVSRPAPRLQPGSSGAATDYCRGVSAEPGVPQGQLRMAFSQQSWTAVVVAT